MEENKSTVLNVDSSGEGTRLDSWLAQKLENKTRSAIQGLIESGHILVDQKTVKSGLKLKAGMTVQIAIPEPVQSGLVPQDIPLDIVYEDDDIIVINKQKDLVVHPAAGNWDGTLVNALLNHCSDLSDINGVIRPGIVHRIDKDTTGLLVAAKNNTAHLRLSEMLKTHDIKRTYEAVVDGVVKEDTGRINAAIGRHPVNRKKMAVNLKNGKDAVTHYQVIKRYKTHTWIRLTLETGRTHQIRVHMAYLGHPVTGDTLYGKKSVLMDTEGQALHARYLDFNHPITGEPLHFEATLPQYFEELLGILEAKT
jgi:23S rRNA pseudouridine1911/1915/1917 synthase